MPIITAAQAFNTVTGLNKRTRAEVPDILLKERDSRPSVHIFNTYTVAWHRQISPHGTFLIPACSDNGEPSNHEAWSPYSKPLIVPSIVFEWYDKGNGESGLNYWDGRLVAQDIIGSSEGVAGNNLERWGVLITAGDKPTTAELAEAKRKLTDTMQKFLQEGDLLYAGTAHERNQLSSIHRKAASYLGQYRLWDVAPLQLVSCTFCMSKISPEAAKCSHCGSIVNREKWAMGQEGYVPPVAPIEAKPTTSKK